MTENSFSVGDQVEEARADLRGRRCRGVIVEVSPLFCTVDFGKYGVRKIAAFALRAGWSAT